MSLYNDPAQRQRDIGGELVKFRTDTLATSDDFEHDANVIFIHGFTAHGTYLEKMASYFEVNRFNTFLFNYDSYRGIEKASEALHALLWGLDVNSKKQSDDEGVVARRKVHLICHSMGGLVARAFTYRRNSCAYLNKIVTLGSPHKGTLNSRFFVRQYINYGAHLTRAVPRFGTKGCLSSQELTGNDTAPSLLSRLVRANDPAAAVPVLSISGGLSRLEFGRSALSNAARNRLLQYLLDHAVNDGLVPETSSSLANDFFADCLASRQHFCDYPEYVDINHSNLIENHDIYVRIILWLRAPFDESGKKVMDYQR